MIIYPIKAYTDNYIWLIQDKNTAWVVDPGDATPVIQFLHQHNLQLKGILLTHHHADHVGGTPELTAKFPDALVYGPKNSATQITNYAAENTTVIALNLKIMEIPGHTLDHVAYYNDDILFCGDTLFGGGCGRVFEGTFTQMVSSLNKINSLPSHTKIYCGHEYTEKNLIFASLVEPENLDIKSRLANTTQLRQNDLPSLPSQLAIERLTNPFLRCQQHAVIAAAQQKAGCNLNNEVDVFTIIRQWKDKF